MRRNIKQYWSSIAPLATKRNSFRDRHKEQGECLLQAIYQLSVIVWFLVIHVIVTHVVSGHPCGFWPSMWSSRMWFFVGCVLFIFSDFSVILLDVFMFWVPCCDVRYDFRIKTMFGSSLPPVVCRRDCVLFTLFVFFCA